MGKKKKAEKKLKRQLKKGRSKQIIHPSASCKTKCCEKYQKSERKRCKRCPCYDLMKEVA